MLRLHVDTQCKLWRAGLEGTLSIAPGEAAYAHGHMGTACHSLRMSNVSEETRAGKLLDENQRHHPLKLPSLVSHGHWLLLLQAVPWP